MINILMTVIRLTNSKLPPGGIRFRMPSTIIDFTPPAPPRGSAATLDDSNFSPIAASGYVFINSTIDATNGQFIGGNFNFANRASARPFLTRFNANLSAVWFSHITYTNVSGGFVGDQVILRGSQTLSGVNIAVGGYRNISNNQFFGFMVQVSSNGTLIRGLNSDLTANISASEFWSVNNLSGGDLIVGGTVRRGIPAPGNAGLIFRTNLSGTVSWARSFATNGIVETIAVDKITNNIYAFTMITALRLHMISYTSTGSLINQYRLNLNESCSLNNAIFYDNHIYVSLSVITPSPTNNGGLVLIKITTSGVVVWIRRLAAGLNNFATFSNIVIDTVNERIYGLGNVEIFSSNTSPIIVRYDLDGVLELARVFASTSGDIQSIGLTFNDPDRAYITTRNTTTPSYTLLWSTVSALTSGFVIGPYTVRIPTSAQLVNGSAFTVTTLSGVEVTANITFTIANAPTLVYTLV